MGKYEPLDAITGHDGDNGLNASVLQNSLLFGKLLKACRTFSRVARESGVHSFQPHEFFCLGLLHDHDSTKTQAKIQLNRSIIKHFLLYSDTLNGKILPHTLDSEGTMSFINMKHMKIRLILNSSAMVTGSTPASMVRY